MRVKICGMRTAENVRAIAELKPQLMGFIFYAPSPRCVDESELQQSLDQVPSDISTVAVFVNESLAEVKRICSTFDFLYAQLHGQESAAYCAALNDIGIAVIKAFAMDEEFEMSSLDEYAAVVDLFLFDTKTSAHGGSGEQFDWSLLSSYYKSTPYLLSGGISAKDIDKVMSLELPGLIGFDANSRLETSPGLKDIDETRTLIDKVKTV